MPPKPFPLQLRVGTDITHVPRIQRLIFKNGHKQAPENLQAFMRRFMTYHEQQLFLARFRGPKGALGNEAESIAFLAGRWAAKEAILKAVHPRRLPLTQIHVLKTKATEFRSGRPYGVILDRPASTRDNGRATAPHILDPNNKITPEERDRSPEAQQINYAAADYADYDAGLTPASEQHEDLPGQIVEISISHDGDYATAVCIAPCEPMPGDVGGEVAAREP